MKRPDAFGIRKFSRALVLLITILAASQARAELVITFGGDLSLGRDGAKPDASGTWTGSDFQTWSDITAGLRPLWNGDLNFANLETVLSSSSTLKRSNKKYAFRTHPAAIEFATDQGLNLYSTANNHFYDFNAPGFLETLSHLERISNTRELFHAGAGHNLEEATDPVVFEKNGIRIAFAAVGITTQNGQRADTYHAGNADFRYPGHYDLVLQKLAQAPVDYRIISIHCGKEGQVELDPGQERDFHRAVDEGHANLVLGHHPHVVRPAEIYRDALLFYSLGNYLITGARSLNGETLEKSYGLFGRVYIDRNEAGTLENQVVELEALTDMSRATRVLEPDQAIRRLDSLNRLAIRSFRKGRPLTVQLKPGRTTGVRCLKATSGVRGRGVCGT